MFQARAIGNVKKAELYRELAQQLEALLAGEPTFRGYTVPRLNLIFGRWMRHGGLYPDRKLRLFRKGFARLREDTEPHATPKTEGPTGELRGDIAHLLGDYYQRNKEYRLSELIEPAPTTSTVQPRSGASGSSGVGRCSAASSAPL